ncbi:MAG: ClpXP protease specificity-enhancing factor [Gammaproteobacteria bacterium]|nr:ClpXP protease specificity-enhancing factor [Gammaproteobacteria bacterium]HXK56200.1 ClpXP protease specificity-enhancing factor [Gammaproteobacteria bacterium]
MVSSNRPYLIRALYEWLVDNSLTPHILVDAAADDVVVPSGFVEEGRIVLNIAPGAVRQLELGNNLISFSARFAGTPMRVMVPPSAVLGIYAKENRQGMLFLEQDAGDGEPPPDDGVDPTPPRDRPTLKLIK